MRPVQRTIRRAPAHHRLYFAASRAGKSRLTLVVESEEHRRIKHLSADTDRSIESLLHEALTDFLHKHNA